MASTTWNGGTLTLPQATITVVATAGFAAGPGKLLVTSASGTQLVTYTAIGTGTTFTGCSGGVGSVVNGNAVITWVSTDDGYSIGLIADNETKIAPAQGFSGLISSSAGNYSLPKIISDPSHNPTDFYPTALLNSSLAASGSGVVPLPRVNTIYYKMVGYYVSGAVYEAFVVTGAPSAASVTNPNTGHALVNTRVAASWIV
jgi:hypothetical protein